MPKIKGEIPKKTLIAGTEGFKSNKEDDVFKISILIQLDK
jgi:hypothetical protein